ncbi:hypothetical protein GOV14_05535 [Candidatus Pacearchaeota archaeon]|nr:hypothetical protein [Candidatus Pacearchaeota archaeon]
MYINLSKPKALIREVFNKYWQDVNEVVFREKEFNKKASRLNEIYLEINSENIAKDMEHSLKLLSEMRDLTWELNALYLFSIYFDKEMCIYFLEDTKCAIAKERFNDLWDFASTPAFASFEQSRLLSLLHCFIKKISEEEIAQNFQYLAATYNKILTKEEIIPYIKKSYSKELENPGKTFKDLKREIRERNKMFEERLATFKGDEKKLIRFIQNIMLYRDKRKDPISMFLASVFRVGKYLFNIIGEDENLIYFSKIEEILHGKKMILDNIKDIKKRSLGFTSLTQWGGKQEEQYGQYDENKKIIEDYLELQNKQESPEIIRGQIGSKGSITGSVKIITNINQQGKDFNEGEILVTGMTRPEFVPLMKKAAAIITDEGGITCHAAIISRELKKPCIIGTKNATRILKDGMKVEVDANEGVVRIMEKK